MKKKVSILLLTLTVACLTGAGFVNRSLVEKRTESQVMPVGVLENAPPLMVFTTVVLGGFRGLIADMLWLRLSQLQGEGKYFELVQLSNWITKLEPHIGNVWAHHAWNMAYNVSIMMPNVEERWRWVRNGIILLRDEGIVYNPGDTWLYFHLAWFFQHKIGQASDDYHMYYKKMWAREMTELLGEPYIDYEKLESDPEKVERMTKEYKLIPAIMKEVDSKYGPLDWRKAHPHALYWAHYGIKKTGKTDDKWLNMIIRQSLVMMEKSYWSGEVME